jgi:site-specific DNA-methyltransferase (adenine-specific)
MPSHVHHTDALRLLESLTDSSIDMIYTDPPFGTGDVQELQHKKQGKVVSKISYSDKHEDFLAFIVPHIRQMHRVLKDSGTMYLHLDWRWVHYVKVECDKVFGYDNFLNEVVWSYNLGGRGKDRWPRKHDTILVYAKETGKHVFNWEAIDRIPYDAPWAQKIGRTPEEAEKRIAEGQVPTDVWQFTLGNTAGERTGYPNQKPLKILKRAIVASCVPGGLVLDPFGGSGATGAAALETGRSFITCDRNPAAIDVMKKRFAEADVQFT